VLVVFTAQGGKITFGLEDMDKQLRRWRAVHDAGQQRGKAIASLDLAVNSSIPVCFSEPSGAPPSTAKLPKKKKHV
jgi:hypothetical protein